MPMNTAARNDPVLLKFLGFIKHHWFVITGLILAVIAFLSLRPLGSLPEVPGTDKLHHFIAYAGLMLPTALRKPRKWILIGLGFLLFSGALELLQHYVNRYRDWLDMGANAAGITFGVLLAYVINISEKAYRKRKSEKG